MSLRWYLIIMSVATIICCSIWSFVVWTIDPQTTNWVGFSLFYFSLFLSLVGLATIIGFLMRFVIFKKHLEMHAVKEAFRQSFLFAFFVIVVLFLLSKELFNWINLATLIIGLSVFEFLLISYQKPIEEQETEKKEEETFQDHIE